MKSNFVKDNIQSKNYIEFNLKIVENILHEQKINRNINKYVEWLKTQTDFRYNGNAEKKFPILNNFIYWAYLGYNIGSEQEKHRPILIVRTEEKSDICTIIPLSDSKLNDIYWYHVDLEERNSTALVEQIRTISKIRIDKPMRLKGKMVRITKEDWKKINEQLEFLYRLKPLKN